MPCLTLTSDLYGNATTEMSPENHRSMTVAFPADIQGGEPGIAIPELISYLKIPCKESKDPHMKIYDKTKTPGGR